MYSYPFIYQKPEKGIPFRQSPSVKATIENTSYPLPLEEIKSPSPPYRSLRHTKKGSRNCMTSKLHVWKSSKSSFWVCEVLLCFVSFCFPWLYHSVDFFVMFVVTCRFDRFLRSGWVLLIAVIFTVSKTRFLSLLQLNLDLH